MMYIPADDEYAAEEDKDNAFKSVSGLTTGETGFMGKTLFPTLVVCKTLQQAELRLL